MRRLMALALLALGSAAHAETIQECLEETGACDVFKNEGNMNTACAYAVEECRKQVEQAAAAEETETDETETER